MTKGYLVFVMMRALRSIR